MCRERGLKKKKKTAGMAEEREVRACVERERERERELRIDTLSTA